MQFYYKSAQPHFHWSARVWNYHDSSNLLTLPYLHAGEEAKALVQILFDECLLQQISSYSCYLIAVYSLYSWVLLLAFCKYGFGSCRVRLILSFKSCSWLFIWKCSWSSPYSGWHTQGIHIKEMEINVAKTIPPQSSSLFYAVPTAERRRVYWYLFLFGLQSQNR